MRLYCRGGTVIATHRDDQHIAPALYGEGTVVVVVPDDAGVSAGDPAPPATTADLVAEATLAIDAIADRVYTTSPSRVARYERKYAEALRYRDAGYPHPVSQADYPTLTQEASARAVTKRQLADLIIAKAVEFSIFAGLVEAKRASLPTVVESAADLPAAQAAVAATITEIEVAAADIE